MSQSFLVPEGSSASLQGRAGDVLSFSPVDGVEEGTSCHFGDDKVPCNIDHETNRLHCRVPHRKRKPQKTPINICPANGKFVEEFEFEYDEDEKVPPSPSLFDSCSICFWRTRNRVEQGANKQVARVPVWVWAFIAEFLGTMALVWFGTGVVASAVLTGSQAGIWQVAVVWGIGVAIAIYSTADVSGAHLNPAVSIALAIFRSRGFCWRLLPVYLVAQFLGSFVAGFLIYATFYPLINQFEDLHDITRGSCESVQTAQFFGEYFPNPGGAGSWYAVGSSDYAFCTDAVQNGDVISPGHCLWLETLSTAILMFVILTVTDPYNTAIDAKAAPFLIGFTVSANISILSCIQLGMNPARDFGPRLAALCLGWGSVAIPGPQNGFWVYIIGPILGAILGALVHDVFLPRQVVQEAKERNSDYNQDLDV